MAEENMLDVKVPLASYEDEKMRLHTYEKWHNSRDPGPRHYERLMDLRSLEQCLIREECFVP